MHGQDSQDSFHWRKGHQNDAHGPGEDLRRNKQPRPDDVWPDIWKLTPDAVKKIAKQKWTIVKKLANDGVLGGKFFIEPNKRRRIQVHNGSRS